MSYTIKQLDRSYNQELLSLSKSRNTGSLLFNTDRSPDFFALSEELGETRYFGLLKDNKLTGSIGVARQIRIINGAPATAYYLFDLKVHPDYTGKPVFYRLIQHVVAHYRDVEKASWVFSTILDSNVNLASLTKGTHLYPGGILIGKNYHVGFPVFVPQRNITQEHSVQYIKPAEAWHFYARLARSKNFAPVDKEIFLKDNGFFIACYERGELAAVSKIMQQAHARKIYLTQPQPIVFRLLNLMCRYYKCPLLPKQGQEFHHGYLSYYSAASNKDYRKDFLKFIQLNHARQFSYIFCGLTEKEASQYSGLFLLKFTSSTYGYGALPPALSLDAIELTLI